MDFQIHCLRADHSYWDIYGRNCVYVSVAEKLLHDGYDIFLLLLKR